MRSPLTTRISGHPAGTAVDWEPIPEKSVETSEVKQYVFQIGPLTLNEEPAFEMERSVAR